jgi:hypothetical protein
MSQNTTDKGEPWFAPKTHGYGAAPITWQGWTLTLGFAALTAGIAWLAVRWLALGHLSAAEAIIGGGVVIGVLTAIFLKICRVKTSGPWRWRWGADAN